MITPFSLKYSVFIRLQTPHFLPAFLSILSQSPLLTPYPPLDVYVLDLVMQSTLFSNCTFSPGIRPFPGFCIHLYCEASLPYIFMCVCVCVPSCPTLCETTYCSLPGSSVHGISQVRILAWVTTSFCSPSSQSRYPT